jgi:hypothetical protein
LALEKVLLPNNITKGFLAIGIYPLNKHNVNKYLIPAKTFGRNSIGDVTAEAGEGESRQLDLGEQGSDEQGEGNEGGGGLAYLPLRNWISRLTLHCSQSPPQNIFL